MKPIACVTLALALLLMAAPAQAARSSKDCKSTTSSGRLTAGLHMSCAFARTIERYVNARQRHPAKVRLTSPLTHKGYTVVRRLDNAQGYVYSVAGDPNDAWMREYY